MALLGPNLVILEIVERAYNAIEVVSEIRRTTAVMTMLSAVSLPLVTVPLRGWSEACRSSVGALYPRYRLCAVHL